MRAGRLRYQVKIQSPQKDTSPGGGEVTWSDFATVWAAIEPLRGSEFFLSQQVNAEVTGKIVMRYLEGVKPDMRILYGSRVFEIDSILDIAERHRELRLLVKERVR